MREDLPSNEELYGMYKRGKSLDKISKELNCGLRTIETKINEYRSFLQVKAIKNQKKGEILNLHCNGCLWYHRKSNFCPFPNRCVKNKGWTAHLNMLIETGKEVDEETIVRTKGELRDGEKIINQPSD